FELADPLVRPRELAFGADAPWCARELQLVLQMHAAVALVLESLLDREQLRVLALELDSHLFVVGSGGERGFEGALELDDPRVQTPDLLVCLDQPPASRLERQLGAAQAPLGQQLVRGPVHFVSGCLTRQAMRDCSDHSSMKPGEADCENSPPDSEKVASCAS